MGAWIVCEKHKKIDMEQEIKGECFSADQDA